MSPINIVKAKEAISISELTLKEKLGQLVIAKPKVIDERWLSLNLGGIFINHLNTSDDYKKHIDYYQDNSKIKLFVTTDMEGYWNPFNFYKSKSFGEINSKEEARALGREQSKVLKELGFNLDFSPIVEVRNEVWKGRSFVGNKSEVNKKIGGYIEGLHSNEILATAKHYPGGSMVKNPHLIKYKAEIFPEDLEYFNHAIESGVDAIMVGHPVVYGAIDSNNKQATVSLEVVGELRKNFDGLIITDAVTMMGLRLSYLFNFKKVYPDLIRAGNDIILDTHIHSNYRQIKRRIGELEKQVNSGELPIELVNERVKKILEFKGYEVQD